MEELHKKVCMLFDTLQAKKQELEHAERLHQEAVDEEGKDITREIVKDVAHQLDQAEKEYWAFQSDLEWMQAQPK